MTKLAGLILCAWVGLSGAELKVRISWGHQSRPATPFFVRLEPSDGVAIRKDGVEDAGGVGFTLVYPQEPEKRLQNLHVIWADLIALSDADTARRLRQDAAFRPNAPRLTVFLNPEGTRGFTVTVDQLLEQRAMWIPSLDVYITAGSTPVAFNDHQKELTAFRGRRILERVRQEPEATYAEYTSRWEDLGNPAYVNPQQRGPGHVVCLTWDSAIPKFGIDRGAGVWNDYGNPDRFQFWFGFGDLAQGIQRAWKSQRLADGLPVITTVFEKDRVRYQVEQFAYPLNGPPAERRGDIAMVLFQKVKLTNLAGASRAVPLSMTHRRQFPKDLKFDVLAERRGKSFVFLESANRRTLFTVEGIEGQPGWSGTQDYQRDQRRIDATIQVELPAKGSRQLVVKLPSPPVNPEEAATLEALDYASAREATVKFWSGYLERGAQFRAPEKIVNDLFRATLWHALRLPRRHGDGHIDLPYSNFAYSQSGTPWPVNQAVYVDYMLYDLRGYHGVSAEELLAQFRNNQAPSGHVKGVANWGVYTPGMLYAVAQHYLLSGDRAALERLLPHALKALDWCLDQLREAAAHAGPAQGLVRAPLNDGTGDGIWAFNQAYMYAGLELFGRVLGEIGHERAGVARAAATAIHTAIARGFGAAAARSPLVQLRDHTWVPYVPCEALTHRRILEQWYPTDVDTGAVHLLRLKALPADGELADWLLEDHEDNLYLKGWGMANEPVYNQQGTAYLLRDDAKAAIRTFYSYMASAFSHSALEPVEHRWTHGQYFGPPSTSGAWFELYRNMLVTEREGGELLLGAATPRKWLEDGKRIEVERAPTYFGKVGLRIDSRAASGRILATAELAGRPKALLIRLRHPQAKPIRAVTVNGQDWKDFDAAKEWVRIANPEPRAYSVVARYD